MSRVPRLSVTARGLGVAAFTALLLAGCGNSSPDLLETLPELAGGVAGISQRDDGPIVVVPYGGGWMATQSITFSGDTAGITLAEVSLSTAVGSVTAAPGASGYRIDLALQANGTTEAEARKALDSMQVQFRDQRRTPRLALSTRVVFRPYQPPSQAGLVELGSVRSASIHAQLPGEPTYTLRQSTDVGSVAATGLTGSLADLHCNVGNAALQGFWKTVSLASNIGDVSFSGTAGALHALTDVGSAYAVLAGVEAIEADLSAAVGNIDVTLATPGIPGYDLVANTEIGTAAIIVNGTEPVGDQQANRAHWRTPDYASHLPKINVRGRSSIGNVTIHD